MRFFYFSFLLIALSVSAGTPRLDRSITHHKTFALQSKFNSSCSIGAGSGTLINPYWILTANHVSGSKKDNALNNVSCSKYERDDSGLFIKTYEEKSYTNPKGEDGEYEFIFDKNEKGYPFYDFTLVRLDKPILNIKPAKLPEIGMFDYSKTYQVNQIGYGNYNGRNGGKKYVRYNSETERWKTEYNLINEILPISNLQWLTIHGDSGSGITVEKDGEQYVIGEIGQWATTDLGWAGSFDDVISKIDWIKETMNKYSLSYVENIDLIEKWGPYSQDEIVNLYAYSSQFNSLNLNFTETNAKENGGYYNYFYAIDGERYTIEALIEEGIKSSNFDVFVNSKQVAHNISVTNRNIKLIINPFTQHGESLIVEFIPIDKYREPLKIDYLFVKRVL